MEILKYVPVLEVDRRKKIVASIFMFLLSLLGLRMVWWFLIDGRHISLSILIVDLICTVSVKERYAN